MIDATTTGDPEGMRALARELLGRAALVRELATPAAGKLTSAVFEGPAATRLSDDAARLTARLGGAGNELEQLARSLLTDAASVELENADLRRQAEEQAQAAADASRGSEAAP